MDKSAWDVKKQDFPKEGNQEDKSRFLIRYAILAPSGHNSQPWKFSIKGTQIWAFADLARALRIADSDDRELFIAAGCTLMNLLIAAKYFGYDPKVIYFPEDGEEELVAIINLSRLVEQQESEVPELFKSITERRTNRRQYEDKTISQEDLTKLQNCCSEKGIRLDLITDQDTKAKVAEFVVRGDILQYSDPAYRRELGYWVGQGAFGHKGIMAKVGSLFVSRTNPGRKTGEKERMLILSAPVLGVLSSAKEDKLSRVKVGEAYEKIALTATSLNIQQHPMNQGLTEVSGHKEELKKALKIQEIPQLPFRLGYAEPTPRQVRRPLEEFLV